LGDSYNTIEELIPKLNFLRAEPILIINILDIEFDGWIHALAKILLH